MFLRTLGLKTDGMVTQLLKAKRRSYEDNIAPINDRRGKHEVYENHKADYEAIRYHKSIQAINKPLYSSQCA